MMRVPFALAFPALAGLLFAADTKIQIKDLPAAVQKTVTEQMKNATLVGVAKEIENGKTVYELETKVNGRGRDLMIGGDGAILSVEQEVDLESVPAPAKTAIEKKAAGGKIKKVETVTEGNKVFYEAAMVVKGKNSEIKVAPDGSPVK
jgi:uncharacterized membrane protein YkoI